MSRRSSLRSSGCRSQIESVLDLTQSEAGLLPIATEEIELLPFVTQVVREREEAIEGKGLTLDLRGDKSAGNGHGRRAPARPRDRQPARQRDRGDPEGRAHP